MPNLYCAVSPVILTVVKITCNLVLFANGINIFLYKNPTNGIFLDLTSAKEETRAQTMMQTVMQTLIETLVISIGMSVMQNQLMQKSAGDIEREDKMIKIG